MFFYHFTCSEFLSVVHERRYLEKCYKKQPLTSIFVSTMEVNECQQPAFFKLYSFVFNRGKRAQMRESKNDELIVFCKLSL